MDLTDEDYETAQDMEIFVLSVLRSLKRAARRKDPTKDGIVIMFSSPENNTVFNSETSRHEFSVVGRASSIIFPGSTGLSFARVIKVVQFSYAAIMESTILSKRDLYYLDVNLFQDQTFSDRAIEMVLAIFQIPRDRLHIVAAIRGLMRGNVEYEMHGVVMNCHQASAIPAQVERIRYIQGFFSMVLVVEKETVFHKLCSQYLPFTPLIVTGKGYPCLATRKFLKRLAHDFPDIPIFSLFDADPYGVEIFATYKFGSKKFSHEPHLALSRIKWIGVRLEDVVELGLIDTQAQPLSSRDRRKINSLMKQEAILKDPELRSQLQLMLDLNRKAEIECLSSLALDFIGSHYIPTRIRSQTL